MGVIIGIIILSVMIYAVMNGYSTKITQKEHNESLERQRDQANRQARKDRKKLVFDQFDAYIKSIFKVKPLYTEEEFTLLLNEDFPLYKNGDTEQLISDLEIAGLVQEEIKKVRNKNPMDISMFDDDYDESNYYDEILIGYKLGRQYTKNNV